MELSEKVKDSKYNFYFQYKEIVELRKSHIPFDTSKVVSTHLTLNPASRRNRYRVNDRIMHSKIPRSIAIEAERGGNNEFRKIISLIIKLMDGDQREYYQYFIIRDIQSRSDGTGTVKLERYFYQKVKTSEGWKSFPLAIPRSEVSYFNQVSLHQEKIHTLNSNIGNVYDYIGETIVTILGWVGPGVMRNATKTILKKTGRMVLFKIAFNLSKVLRNKLIAIIIAKGFTEFARSFTSALVKELLKRYKWKFQGQNVKEDNEKMLKRIFTQTAIEMTFQKVLSNRLESKISTYLKKMKSEQTLVNTLMKEFPMVGKTINIKSSHKYVDFLVGPPTKVPSNILNALQKSISDNLLDFAPNQSADRQLEDEIYGIIRGTCKNYVEHFLSH